MKLNNNQKAFFALLRAGLWERNVEIGKYGDTDFSEILRLATEQSVVGLVAAGVEHVTDVKVPQEWALQFVGQTLQLEQRNKAMNAFVAELIQKLRGEGVYALMVKGQGIAQCYQKPLWRACGDVDLFLSEENYTKALGYLRTKASSMEEEDPYTKHVGMTIGNWEVELHGNLRGVFSGRADKVLDAIKDETFYYGNVRSQEFKNSSGSTVQVFMMSATNDVVYVFTHILHHFFRGGIGLRQICDWCRLMWTYRDALDFRALESWIRKAGLMSEWRAFYNLASRYLGMPDYGEDLMVKDSRFDKKADRIVSRVLTTGNFGHNVDESFRREKPFLERKAIAAWRYFSEMFVNFRVFPLDALRASGITLKSGLMSTLWLK